MTDTRPIPRLALVVPRYGANVAGGAESLARGFAETWAQRGWHIEVWTTCAENHYTWENTLPPGSTVENGVMVRRFPITHWDPDQRAQADMRLATWGRVPEETAWAWLESGAHSAPLYAHIMRHADEFDALIAIPYAMPLTHFAAWSAPHKTLLWPCLHNEPYAFMLPTRLLVENVFGVLFNSPEEAHLLTDLLGYTVRRAAVVGVGVTLPNPPSPSPNAHRDLLYVGRLEEGKNVPLLYTYVRRYADQGGQVRLHLLGKGPYEPPEHPAFVLHGFVSEEAKAAAYANALALCQPSLNESFSLSIMEAWLAGRPVLVHADCAVTVGHVRRAQGGLWFRTFDEFVSAVEWLRAHPEAATRMGRNGREYVQRNYTWDAVVDRFVRAWQTWPRMHLAEKRP
nr:glycosyltransferase family 4 protein [Ardenticatena sp.]